MDILNYIDKMQQMYGDKEPSSMVQEPRSNYSNGLKVNPVADSGKKLNEVIAAYERYRGGRKNPVIKFNKFFELYAAENFADGGSAGQLVQPSGDGSRIGFDAGGNLNLLLENKQQLVLSTEKKIFNLKLVNKEL